MQLILTYIIVAIALVFAGRGTYRLFRNAKKGKGCSDINSSFNMMVRPMLDFKCKRMGILTTFLDSTFKILDL